MTNKITILQEGYSRMVENGGVMKANCTCTLIQCHTGVNIIVDTLDAWSGSALMEALTKAGVTPDQINFCVSTHGHIDHMGNNNLFLQASKHIVGQTISHGDEYFLHDFTEKSFFVTPDVEIVATKGHTLTCVSVICRNSSLGGTVAVVGDLFEHENDIDRPELWRDDAGSEAVMDQMRNREKMARIADWIVPGHGPMFRVEPKIRQKLEEQLKKSISG